MDVQKLFNEELPALLAKNATDAKSIGARFQFNVTGAGSWHVNTTSTGPTVAPGVADADCTITIASADFETLMQDPSANGMKLFFGGKLKISGNQMLATRFAKILTYK